MTSHPVIRFPSGFQPNLSQSWEFTFPLHISNIPRTEKETRQVENMIRMAQFSVSDDVTQRLSILVGFRFLLLTLGSSDTFFKYILPFSKKTRQVEKLIRREIGISPMTSHYVTRFPVQFEWKTLHLSVTWKFWFIYSFQIYLDQKIN